MVIRKPQVPPLFRELLTEVAKTEKFGQVLESARIHACGKPIFIGINSAICDPRTG